MIKNPILPGFNPDPAILRVGDDYYIATSTFEWFPGIQIHHSRDLKHWKLITHILQDKAHLDLDGVPSNCGIWAPCLTYCEKEKLFYVCYTIMRNTTNGSFDMENYIATSKSIMGPWSDRVYVNSSGFDPSLLHDDDGRKWFINLSWEIRKGYEQPGVIIAQEYSAQEKKLIGKRSVIYSGGTDLGCLEGPHIYKINGWYYILCAEGGTGYGHAVTLSRSKNVLGPYEASPYNPLITSCKEKFNGRQEIDYLKPRLYNPDSYLQKSGHGSLVGTQYDEWYIAHLCSRPIMPQQRCTLGRETALQKVVWTDDGWLRMSSGSHFAEEYTGESTLPDHKFDSFPQRDDFDSDKLDVNFSTLRQPFDSSWASLSERKGFLRLYGRNSLNSLFDVSVVARRVQHFRVKAETCVEFEPENYQHMAGLVLMHGNLTNYFLRVYYSESMGCKCIGIAMSNVNGRDEVLEDSVGINGIEKIYLKACVNYADLQFYYSFDGKAWEKIGGVLDMTLLSDEYNPGGMTGAFVGMCAHDYDTRTKYADFDYFSYLEFPEKG